MNKNIGKVFADLVWSTLDLGDSPEDVFEGAFYALDIEDEGEFLLTKKEKKTVESLSELGFGEGFSRLVNYACENKKFGFIEDELHYLFVNDPKTYDCDNADMVFDQLSFSHSLGVVGGTGGLTVAKDIKDIISFIETGEIVLKKKEEILSGLKKTYGYLTSVSEPMIKVMWNMAHEYWHYAKSEQLYDGGGRSNDVWTVGFARYKDPVYKYEVHLDTAARFETDQGSVRGYVVAAFRPEGNDLYVDFSLGHEKYLSEHCVGRDPDSEKPIPEATYKVTLNGKEAEELGKHFSKLDINKYAHELFDNISERDL